MPDENVAPEATPTTVVTEPIVENKKPEIKIDSSKPLSQQVSKLSALMGDTTEPVVEAVEEVVEEIAEEPIIEQEEDVDDIEVKQPVDLGTAEQYIFDRLPDISATIQVGDKIQTVRVKSDVQLPQGFSFPDAASQTQFLRDLTSQSMRAEKLLDQYNGEQYNARVKDFEVQESKDIADDLARLQRQGIVPKFDENTPDSDPGVKEASEILDLFRKTNAEYAQKYLGTNRTFRISYADAADKYYAGKARADRMSKVRNEKPIVEPKVDNTERQTIARKIGGAPNAEVTSTRPKAQPGMSMNDINRLFTQGRI